VEVRKLISDGLKENRKVYLTNKAKPPTTRNQTRKITENTSNLRSKASGVGLKQQRGGMNRPPIFHPSVVRTLSVLDS